MAWKRSLIAGFGIGYVLGARAGRERYEQIVTWWGQLTGSPKVQEVAQKTKAVATDTTKRGLSAVQEGVEKAGGAVKERLQKDDSSVIDLDRATGGTTTPTTATTGTTGTGTTTGTTGTGTTTASTTTGTTATRSTTGGGGTATRTATDRTTGTDGKATGTS